MNTAWQSSPLALTLLLVVAAPAALAQDPFSLERPDPQNIEQFGSAVAAHGDRIVVGAIGDRSLLGTSPTGAAYVYARSVDGWTLEATLHPFDFPELSPAVSFGQSVAIEGDVIVVGAPFEYMHLDMGGDASTQGAVYVFRYNGSEWVGEAKLAQPPFTNQQRYFGTAVDIQGDRIVATELGFVISGGSPGYSCVHPPSEPGQARLFVRSASGDWEPEAVLVPIDGQTGNSFGNAVALDGDRVAVGAFKWYDPDICTNQDTTGNGLIDGTERGAAYVYRFTGDSWAGETIVHPPNHEDGDQFAHDLALSGSTLLVGAPFTDEIGGRFGAAFSFEHTGGSWGLDQVYAGQDTNTGDRFGYSVDIDGDYSIIGAPRHNNDDLNLGAMYAFERIDGEWQQGLQITLDAETGDFDFAGPLSFGHAVAVSTLDFVIGAPDDPRISGTNSGDRVGSAHAFSIQQLFNPPVSSDPDAPSIAFRLEQPYPNPSRGAVALTFELEEPARARLAIYDILGRQVALILDELRQPGAQQVVVDGALLPAAGAYVVRLEVQGQSVSRRLMRL